MVLITKVSLVKGMNVSKPAHTRVSKVPGEAMSRRAPLNSVMMAVAMRANHEPHGWKGALYGRASRDRP